MEDHRKIKISCLPIVTPILLVPKPDGTPLLCVDYQGSNKITIKNKYPLPLMRQLRSWLGKATIFIKLVLNNSDYLVYIVEGDAWKTAF